MGKILSAFILSISIAVLSSGCTKNDIVNSDFSQAQSFKVNCINAEKTSSINANNEEYYYYKVPYCMIYRYSYETGENELCFTSEYMIEMYSVVDEYLYYAYSQEEQFFINRVDLTNKSEENVYFNRDESKIYEYFNEIDGGLYQGGITTKTEQCVMLGNTKVYFNKYSNKTSLFCFRSEDVIRYKTDDRINIGS